MAAAVAVVLAAGRGRRMRASSPDPSLDLSQREAAARGDKVMMPVGRRPFLDYVLHDLAEAGVRRACLVIRPDAGEIARRYRARRADRRLVISIATQTEPLGTAHAVLCAEPVVAGEPFLVVNGDNLYPVAALQALAALGGPGLVGFERAALVAGGCFPPERVAQFALARIGPGGFLERIVEKPEPADVIALGPEALVSMNAWRFEADIFDGCRRLRPSRRGELELQDAVSEALASGCRYTVIPWAGEVIDLTSAEDVPAVSRHLRGVTVRL